MPFYVAMGAAPIIALAPITNQWFGITNPVAKMTVVAVMVFFPVMINMTRGLGDVGTDKLELMRSLAASEGEHPAEGPPPQCPALSVLGA